LSAAFGDEPEQRSFKLGAKIPGAVALTLCFNDLERRGFSKLRDVLSELTPAGQWPRLVEQTARNDSSVSLAISQAIDRLVFTEGVIPGGRPWVEVSGYYGQLPHRSVLGIRTGREKGSGVLVDGGRACITAAHVVRREAQPSAPLSQLHVYLGPVGARRRLQIAGRPLVPSGWSGIAGDHLDIAIIPLAQTGEVAAEYVNVPDGAWSGLSGACSLMAYARAGSLRDPALRIVGPEASSWPSEETLWMAPIREIGPLDRDKRLVGHWSITVGGWSGAPIFARVANVWSVIAIHVSDDAQTPEKWLNCAVRMSGEALQFIDTSLGRM
jgi:hypothetical protein